MKARREDGTDEKSFKPADRTRQGPPEAPPKEVAKKLRVSLRALHRGIEEKADAVVDESGWEQMKQPRRLGRPPKEKSMTHARHKDMEPSEQLAEDLVRELLKDEKGPKFGAEARRLLQMGLPIHYSDDAYPGETVKMYPDGRREIVTLDENCHEVLVRKIPDESID